MVDGSTLVEQGVAYFSSSAEAEDDAERLLGSAWPGTPSEDFATVDDAEEDGWHYVGEAGEPAFDMSVSPAVGYSLPAFRLREAGIVDIVAGVVLSEDGGTLFTLPADYRPSAAFVFPLAKYTTGGGLAPSYGSVNTSGNVAVENGEAFNTDVFWINLSFFLLPPTAAS